MPHIVVSACSVCEASVAFKGETEALEERGEIEDPVAAPLEDLDLVVEPLHKATVVTCQKVIRDFLFPLLKRVEKAVVTAQATGAHCLLPRRQLLERGVLGKRGIKNVGQLLPIRIRLL